MMAWIRTLAAHILLQLRVGLRDSAYVFSTILLPAGIYWFFAVPESIDDYIATYLVFSFCAFSFFGVVFFQYSINTAYEKESAWAQYLQTLPCSTLQMVLSRFVTSSLFGLFSCALIYLVAGYTTPTELTVPVFLKVWGILALGSLPFLFFGLLTGSLCSGRAILPVSNFLYLVLSFAGGLWKPPELLPDVLQKLVWYLPTYHYGELVWPVAEGMAAAPREHVLFLASFALISWVVHGVYSRRLRSA